jgi:hypothetical protein
MPGPRTSAPRTRGGWRHQRPFVGALLIAIAGVEMFFSTQLDIGALHIQMGIEGFQATIIPVALVLLGALILAMPQHRIFYGVIALALSIYSIVGVNLGGFLIGMLLSAVGGILVVSWAPRAVAAEAVAAESGAPELAAETEAVSPEPVLVSAGTGSGDRELHAEFASYSSLVAIARASELTHAAA